MSDIEVEKLDYLIRMKMENPEEYRKYMNAFKEIMKEFKQIIEELV